MALGLNKSGWFVRPLARAAVGMGILPGWAFGNGAVSRSSQWRRVGGLLSGSEKNLSSISTEQAMRTLGNHAREVVGVRGL
jgi:hypothetical protein